MATLELYRKRTNATFRVSSGLWSSLSTQPLARKRFDCLKALAERAKLAPDGFLATQVLRHVRNAVFVGWRRPAYRLTMAWSLNVGEHNAVFEAVTQPACAG
jgi:hypothetical protein